MLSIAPIIVISLLPLVTSECMMSNVVCEFYLTIDLKLTMMHNKDLVFLDNGRLYKHDVENTSQAEPVPVDEVITADGWPEPRLLAVVNGTLPGPDIIVYEDQTVIVHVKNNMRSDATTIHWHGLHQPATPWMDGVPYVTQCPIQPRQTFRYEFKAKPRGTFWYHSHMGAQVSRGLYGAFIIRERKEHEMREHIMQLQDWNYDPDADMIASKGITGIYHNGKAWDSPAALDGSAFSPFKLRSLLINGRGRLDIPTDNQAPLEVFSVATGNKYRFRVIGAAAAHPVRVSIDMHVLTVTASDGYDLEPMETESLIVHPGERFDFEITANKPVDNYWIRGLSLELNQEHKVNAILRYDGAPETDPTSSRDNCTLGSPCLVLNCPFLYYPEEHTICRTMGDMKSATIDDPAPRAYEGRFKEFFLNFYNIPMPTVNGRFFHVPDVNLLTQSTEWHSPCLEPDCGEDKLCTCTNTLEIEEGDIVQLVMLTMGKGKGKSHPIHMHGHSFYVVKMGYGQYNETTAKIEGDNLDIHCRGHPDRTQSFCNDATWSNETWLNGNVPGLELDKPPRKDTIVVPTGGYMVIRFRADNPGLWFLHCHIETHSILGMALLLNESFASIPAPPRGFPECHSFPRSDNYFRLNAKTRCDN